MQRRLLVRPFPPPKPHSTHLLDPKPIVIRVPRLAARAPALRKNPDLRAHPAPRRRDERLAQAREPRAVRPIRKLRAPARGHASSEQYTLRLHRRMRRLSLVRARTRALTHAL